MRNNYSNKENEFINNLINEINKFYYANKKDNLEYHSLEHMRYVYFCTIIPSFEYQLSNDDRISLYSAALLHDIGVLIDYNNHEKLSAEIAYDIMRIIGAPNKITDNVVDLILSTSLKYPSNNISEKILYDSNYDYLSRPDFIKMSFKLRQEWNSNCIYKFVNIEGWLSYQLDFLKNFRFTTVTDRRLRIRGLAWNISLISKLLSDKLVAKH